MDSHQMAAAQRIQGRQAAEQAIALGLEACESEQAKAGFARALLRLADEILKPKDSFDAEAFENERINFGTHNGKRYREVPMAYLDWVVESNSRLRSYVGSTQAIRRREQEDKEKADGPNQQHLDF